MNSAATLGSLANPFAVLTFLAGPALLTNASTVLLLGTGNRFARAVDRTRALAALIGTAQAPGQIEFYRRQLATAQRRGLMMVRALTAFYLAVGCFGLGTLGSLLGATLGTLEGGLWLQGLLSGVLGAASIGVASLVAGAGLLLVESRLALAMLRAEAAQIGEEAGLRPKARGAKHLAG
jgi:hypothetical protein